MRSKIFILFIIANVNLLTVGTNAIQAGSIQDWFSNYLGKSYDQVFYTLLESLLSPLALRIGAGVCLLISIIVTFRTRNPYLGLVFFGLSCFIAYVLPFLREWYAF